MKPIPLMKPDLRGDEFEAVRDVLASGYLTEGPKTRAFEHAIAEYVETEHAVAFSSCTSALEVALRAAGIGAGDDVIVPDYTYPATADVVYLVGATPVLVDVSLDTGNINPRELSAAITEKTKAVLPVSLFGHPVDSEVYDIAAEKGIPIIEDAACSLGAAVQGQKVGSFADATCFSFHPRKIITTGEGGMLVTDDADLAERARCFKHFGGVIDEQNRSRTRFESIGANYKLSDILAALGSHQLERIDDIIGERVEKAKIYDNLLGDIKGITVPSVPPEITHTYQTYHILVEKPNVRDRLIATLREKGIEAQIGTYALHLQPCFSQTPRKGMLPNATDLYQNGLSLPLHHELTTSDQQRIAEELKKALHAL